MYFDSVNGIVSVRNQTKELVKGKYVSGSFASYFIGGIPSDLRMRCVFLFCFVLFVSFLFFTVQFVTALLKTNDSVQFGFFLFIKSIVSK